MLLKGAAATRALARPDDAVRLYVLAGPDESGSRAMLADFAKAMGADAERVELTPGQLKDDPALLADEAAAIGLFGGRRWISVAVMSGGGDELVGACTNLLEAAAAGNPAVVVGGTLTGRSKLTKLAEKHPAAVAVISWLPDGATADGIAASIAEPLGLTLPREVAREITQATGGDRGLMAREIEKLALYLDAAPAERQRVEMDDWRAIGATLPEDDTDGAVNIVLGGRIAQLPGLFHKLETTGANMIPLLRALARRALMLAALRVHVENGQSPRQVVEAQGKAIFWKEKDAVMQQLGRWDAGSVARLIDRLHALERDLKAPDNTGNLLLRAGLLDIARAASARR